jgi:hypothetical protein
MNRYYNPRCSKLIRSGRDKVCHKNIVGNRQSSSVVQISRDHQGKEEAALYAETGTGGFSTRGPGQAWTSVCLPERRPKTRQSTPRSAQRKKKEEERARDDVRALGEGPADRVHGQHEGEEGGGAGAPPAERACVGGRAAGGVPEEDPPGGALARGSTWRRGGRGRTRCRAEQGRRRGPRQRGTRRRRRPGRRPSAGAPSRAGARAAGAGS